MDTLKPNLKTAGVKKATVTSPRVEFSISASTTVFDVIQTLYKISPEEANRLCISYNVNESDEVIAFKSTDLVTDVIQKFKDLEKEDKKPILQLDQFNSGEPKEISNRLREEYLASRSALQQLLEH